MNSNTVISMPSQLFTMRSSFKAVANGSVYIGEVDTDPTIPTNQIQVYIEQENGTLVPVAQPIKINSAGLLTASGQVQKFVLTNTEYSMTVQNSYGVDEFYFPRVYDQGISTALEVEERLLGPGAKIYRGSNGQYVQVGDIIPSSPKYSHVMSIIGGEVEVLAMSPQSSGEISSLNESMAIVGGSEVKLYPSNQRFFQTVSDMKGYESHAIGSKVSTGFTSWKIVDKETNWPTATAGLYAKPLNGLCFLDYGAAGDYFLEDKTINPSPTNDTAAILAAIADMDFDGSISGAGKGYYYDQTIKIDTNKKVRDAYFKQADGVTDYAIWFGDSTTEAPGNYEGRRLRVVNVTIDPNQDCPVVARFRGLQNCYFDHLYIEPPVAPASPTAQTYALMDGVLGTKFEKCSFQPKDELSKILEMRLMRNLANTANAGNGLSSTSTTFSGCNLRRAQNLGTILGDSILFNEETIFEFTEDGFIVQETGSIAEFNNCYWEEIDNYKVYVRGVDSRNPATHVRVIGGKVQQGDNNGSEPNRAFFKVEHGYDVEMNGTIFQGRAQTRLVEFVAGGNGFIDGRVRINANYGQNPRKESGVKSGSVTIPTSSNVATVTSVGHGLISGDVIDVVSNDQLDPINGTNLILPNRVITYVDGDTFTYLTVGTSTATVSANITYEKYKSSSNCLANQDAPSSLLTQVGELRQVGANLYDFADCTTEFVEFSYDAAGAVNEQVLSCNGRDRWSCDSVAFIKSVRYIDDSNVDSTRFATLRYGGVKYTRTNVTTVNNEDDAYASTVKYISPYRIEPGEPVQAFAWSGGASYPRRLTVIIEVAKTGLTYTKDQ